MFNIFASGQNASDFSEAKADRFDGRSRSELMMRDQQASSQRSCRVACYAGQADLGWISSHNGSFSTVISIFCASQLNGLPGIGPISKYQKSLARTSRISAHANGFPMQFAGPTLKG
jgi:hypothetical protein